MPAMTPPRLLRRPTADRYQDDYRLWQGIASLERTTAGRLYAAWYSGMETERGGNFVVVSTSDDGGDSWRSVEMVIEHDDPSVRCYDPCLWRDPLGRLWITWNQSVEFFDGRCGVWAIVSSNADSEQPDWSEPRRIANGIMMNKPIATSAGEWLFPCAIWSDHTPTEDHPEMADERFSNVYVSTDHGDTVSYRGSADVPNRQFDEHVLVERRDGSIWMLVRCYDGIGESFSTDGGRTWSPGRKSHIPGPCSRFHVSRLASGRLLMINHVDFEAPLSREEVAAQGNVKVWRGRTNLTALLSDDDGATWPHALLLDDGADVSYPDACQGEDGTLYVIYDNSRMTKRSIHLARITEEDILAGNLVDDASRLQLTVNVARALPERI
ncbi:sialidase family protein [Ruania albidiflava]|uniref:sialidase family protein n=1 Tax=Ruania albidiflava TaxID=366586 RepID=UPI001B7FE9A6|nr:sialidase family protein [Ruania albidiflava]